MDEAAAAKAHDLYTRQGGQRVGHFGAPSLQGVELVSTCARVWERPKNEDTFWLLRGVLEVPLKVHIRVSICPMLYMDNVCMHCMLVVCT